MLAMKRLSANLETTAELARQFVERLLRARRATRGAAKQALLVALEGDLGSGKTTFVQGVARALGLKRRVVSPTFVLRRDYLLPSQGREGEGASFRRLVHLDCYRLEPTDNLGPLAWEELLADPSNLVFLEWPERLDPRHLPRHGRGPRIHFRFIDEGTREIIFLDQ